MTRLLLILLVLPGCAGLAEQFGDALADPVVQDGLTQTAVGAATGNWAGALWGLGGTVAAVCTYKKLKKGPAT